LSNQGYTNQFDAGWKIIHDDKTLAGRVVTAQYMPSRPDVDSIIKSKGKAEGRIGAPNSLSRPEIACHLVAGKALQVLV
jgi:4-hydroxy-4-methyl-2-oxoglutarate aldolase